MNKKEIVEYLRRGYVHVEDGTCLLPIFLNALALTIDQGGGCPKCGGDGLVLDDRTPQDACYRIRLKCAHCNGTGISPELAELLAQLGVKA